MGKEGAKGGRGRRAGGRRARGRRAARPRWPRSAKASGRPRQRQAAPGWGAPRRGEAGRGGVSGGARGRAIHLLRLGGADDLGEPGAPSGSRDEAELRLRQPEARSGADDAHVAREGPFESTGDGGPLDDGDRDEGRLGDGLEGALGLEVERVARAWVGDALEVGARAEEARVRRVEDDRLGALPSGEARAGGRHGRGR